MTPNTRSGSQALEPPRETTTHPSRANLITASSNEPDPSQSSAMTDQEGGVTPSRQDLMDLPLEELRRQAQEIRDAEERRELIAVIQQGTSAPQTARKHDRDGSISSIPPPKRPLLSRIPAKEEQYHTTNYANYCSFTRKIKAYGDTGNYSDEDLLHLAVLYLDSTLQGIWELESAAKDNPTWNDLCEFLQLQLGDPADRLHMAWSKALRMRAMEGENDYAYLQRWREQWSELGDEGLDINTIMLRIFFESYPATVKQRVREQSQFPTTLAELVSLITKLRPSLPVPPRGQSNQGTRSANHLPRKNSPPRGSREKPKTSQGYDRPGYSKGRKEGSPSNRDQGTRCFKCNEPGHIKPNCPRLATNQATTI
jgi:hypothetical protein